MAAMGLERQPRQENKLGGNLDMLLAFKARHGLIVLDRRLDAIHPSVGS